ncbi:MAG: UvrD-helicase domain-containing protein [Bacillota bacterium]|nr:UvrD-helicase domain-containing protein [Bacillota bacterium]
MDILQGLNEQQLQAVTAEKQHMLVIAGAGSGKTKVLVSRVAWLISEKKINPYHILAVTFTNKAANEMKERIQKMLDINTRWMWIGTFHSLCARILRQEGESFGLGRNFLIYDDADCRALIKRALAELNLANEEKSYHPAAVQAAISDAKNKLITSSEYLSSAGDEWNRNIGQLYRRYQQMLKDNHALDFDDLLTHTLWYLQRYPEILVRYQERFSNVLVDEYQDTNHCQYMLVKLLAGEKNNIFAVGDPDQSIYRWRGADISNILDFSKDYKDSVELRLTQNYRSTQNILDAANAVIANNKSRRPKELFTESGSGDLINVHQSDSDREEAAYVVRHVVALQEEGYALKDCAVLFRTHGQSRLLEDACIKYNLPYRVYGGMKFYERKEVKDTLAYLRILVNPHDDEALRRIYNEPRRGIGKATWDKLTEIAGERGCSLWTLLGESLSLSMAKAVQNKLDSLHNLLESLIFFANSNQLVKEIIRETWQRTGYADMVAASEGGADKMEILEQLMDTASEFDEMYEDLLLSAGDEDVADPPLLSFLSQVSLATDMDSTEEEGSSYLTLMTLHAAKGLEFPVVFMVGMEEGVFPHKRVLFSTDPAEMEEERRLCYVGLTRAEKRLFLTAANRRQYWGKFETNKPSRFLEEIPEHLIVRSGSQQKPQQKIRQEYTTTNNVFQPRIMKEKEVKHSAESAASVLVGDRLQHAKFGVGVAIAVSGSGDELQITVAFPDVGVKKLLWKYAPMKKI